MYDYRMYYTKMYLSSHKLLVERARWFGSLSNVHGVQDDEYQTVFICLDK